jgi:hypothetical protein
MPNWKYIGFLIAVIGAAMGYVYAGSEIRTIHVTGKHVEEGVGRRGRPTERLIVETENGELPILKFPVIGYSFGANDAYRKLPSFGEVRVRIGYWPPAIVSKHAKPHILQVYDGELGIAEMRGETTSPSPSHSEMTVHLVPLGNSRRPD